MDFLEFFNRCAELSVVREDIFIRATSMDTSITENATGLDSLDGVLTYQYISEVFDLDDEAAMNMPTTSIQDLKDYCDKHKNRDFNTVEEAMEVIG
jgi:hypothetical protein